jgi:segregation and condensation protein B
MEISNLIPHIEALIFASDKPLTTIEITELVNSAFGFMDDKINLDQVESAVDGIVEKYQSEFYPFEVRQSGGGWQFLTKKEFHKTVAQLNGEKFLKRLSAAALETLAIIAYKQPVTKGEIETIRGVSTDYTIQKLLEKELIVISGRNEQLPGHPLIYATSKSFMDYFGINSPEDLPKIREVLAEQIVEPTLINHTDFEQISTMVVSDEGELIDQDTALEGEIPGSELLIQDGGADQHDGDAMNSSVAGEISNADTTATDSGEIEQWQTEMTDEENTDNSSLDDNDAPDRKRDSGNKAEDASESHEDQ